MTVKECLIQARGLIDKGWTKERWACDKYRKEVLALSPRACRFCATGAISATGAGPQTRSRARVRLMKQISKIKIPGYDNEYFLTIAGFNDAKATKKDDVLAVFDKAIAGCR